MNRSKKLCVLLGVFTVACIATFAVTRMEERKEQIREAGEIILELPAESVQTLSWTYEDNTLSFHRDEAWLYDEDEDFPVSEEKIRELLAQFQSLGAAFIIEDVENFGQYGLDDPICTIKLSAEDQDYEVKLGDYSKMDAQRYVSIGDGNVYLVNHDPLDEYGAVLSDMIDHDETPSFDHVTQVQFAGNETYSITYQEDSADTYSDDDIYFAQQNGKALPLDTSKVENYLQSITNLDPTDYVTYNVTEEELETYGLDEPALTVTVDFTAEAEDGGEIADSFVLHISPDPEAAGGTQDGEEAEVPAYVRVGESQIVYQIPASSYKKLAAASCNDLRHSEVFWADFAAVQQLDVTLEGSSYTFTPAEAGDGDTWLYVGTEFDVVDLRAELKALLAEEFTDAQPTQQEEISLTVHLDDENFPQVQITLYRYDGEHCLAVVDGESVSLVERSAAVALIEAVHAIVLD